MIANELYQGDSLDWDESESDYPASSSWVIHYVLVNASSRITFNSSADGDDHNFTIATTTTAAWKDGEYTYTRYATDGTERVTLNRGTVEIKKDFTTASDQRSNAKKTLEAIEAVIEDRATKDQESYTIQGRSLSRMNIKDLIWFRDYYASKVQKEKGLKNKIRVRF